MIRALTMWLYRHLCHVCDGWIWSRSHHGEHADCYHARRLALYRRGVEMWKPMEMPKWVDPCPDCGAVLT